MDEDQELTRGDCIADPYYVGGQHREVISAIPSDAVDSTPTPSILQFSDLPREVQRRLTKAYERDRLAMKPMRREMNGNIAVDAEGRRYAIAKDGSRRRVEFAPDGVYTVTKWSKAKRKAMKRERNRAASVAP